jgi:hypothetical protein
LGYLLAGKIRKLGGINTHRDQNADLLETHH